MSRRCEITGKGVMTGNNVSHANNRTRREFGPNIQQVSFLSESLGKVRMRSTTSGIRTVEKNGGIDTYLLNTPKRKLTDTTRKLKRKLEKIQASA